MLIYSHVPDANAPPPSHWPPLPPSSQKKVATYLNSAWKRDFIFFSMDGIKDGNVKVTSHLYPHGVLKLLKFNVGYIMQILAKFKNLQTSKALVTQNTLCKYSRNSDFCV